MNIVFDLDGTLALVGHRKHLIQGDAPDWPAFYRACVHDEPNWPVLRILQSLAGRYDIWVLTGRSSEVADETMDWLESCLPGIDLTLLMRDEGDHTPDHKLKAWWVEECGLTPENTTAVFEDRDKVVAMWRDKGFTCCQVAEGGF
ncbi:hypothetical protein [Halomonas sp. NO4]|uniref:phosphatase domain-containing protein n=1 Tax=Halomonas sp. NO4 TaxID=2484813 RepID=UPI0013D6F550|nr:hypothetical protein [Halomonas sp. NO4]